MQHGRLFADDELQLRVDAPSTFRHQRHAQHVERGSQIPPGDLSARPAVLVQPTGVEAAVSFAGTSETPVANVGCRRAPRYHPQGAREQRTIAVFGGASGREQPGQFERPARVALHRYFARRTHCVSPAHGGDQTIRTFGARERKQVDGVAVEPTKETAANLSRMVLDHPVVLRGDEVVVELLRQSHQVREIHRARTGIGVPNRLVP